MLSNLDYNIYFELAALPVDLIVLFFVLGNYKNEEEPNFRFKVFASFVTVGCILDIVTAILCSTENIPNWFRMFFYTYVNFMSVCAGMAYYLYMCAFSGFKKRKGILVVGYLINSIYFVLLLINMFTGIAYSYDDSGDAVHGPLFVPIVYMVPLFYVVLGTLLVFKQKKKFSRVQRTFMFIGLIAVLSIFLGQSGRSESTLMIFYIASIGMLMLFLTLESPDHLRLLKTIEELDTSRTREKAALDKIGETEENNSKLMVHLSHEMKTPVNAILGYSDAIIKSDVSDETRENAINVFKGAKRLNQFMNELTDYASDRNRLSETMMPYYSEYDKEGGDRFEDFELSDLRAAERAIHESRRYNFKRDSAQYKILCVDDNELNLDLLVRIVSSFGFTVDAAANGKEALDMVKKNFYDLIFMDHMMPVIDGVEAMHIMRDDGLCDFTPIVVVTANAVRGEKEKYLKEGFDSYIPKPFSNGSILRVIGKFLPIAEMDTLVKVNDKAGISRFMLASTFSRPLICPAARFLISGSDSDNINRIARLFSTTMGKVDVVYDGDECIRYITDNEYDIIFVEDGLSNSSGGNIKNYIWNNVNVPSILMTDVSTAHDPVIIYESYTDYMDIGSGPEIIDALLLLYLPKSKVSVIGAADSNGHVSNELEKETENIVSVSDALKVGSSLPEDVTDIEELDIDLGLDNCGSEEGLLKALEIFAGNAASKADEIEDFRKNGMLEDYIIRVHALKSSARIIGAVNLSEKARLLEEAGKNNDISYIDQNNDILLRDFRNLGNKLKNVFTDKASDNKELIPDEKLQDAYNTIYELAQMMDYDSLELIFESLKEYSFKENDRLKLERIKKAMDELNWDGVLNAAKESL
ncbi:MAG: response regulator [Lachnospiraceae bacterium]|nr:response regulator [Lachnospiraceae bacterium]